MNTLPLDTIIHGDALAELRNMPDNSVDAIISDPPSGIHFMSSAWDHNKGGRDQWIAWLTDIMSEALRVLKPGGHCLIWALPRTAHWTATAIEDAGFEIRDRIHHVYAGDTDLAAFLASLNTNQQEAFERLMDAQATPFNLLAIFGSGFPKSANISAMIDKHLGKEREVVGTKRAGIGRHGRNDYEVFHGSADETFKQVDITKPATPEAERYSGYGSALKPSVENWVLARKPLSESSIAANVLKWGTGGLAIDQCRVGYVSEQDLHNRQSRTGNHAGNAYGSKANVCFSGGELAPVNPQGRFPSHLLLSHSLFCQPHGVQNGCAPECPIQALDKQSGITKTGNIRPHMNKANSAVSFLKGDKVPMITGSHVGDTGTASRYFQQFTPDDPAFVPFYYAPKASRRERNAGCEGLPEKQAQRISRSEGLTIRRCSEHNTSLPSGGNVYSCGCPIQYEQAKKGNNGMSGANTHPTVKSQQLMCWLVRLITPPNGVVLDMFAGSGSTCVAAIAEHVHFIGIEQDSEYCTIARARIAHAQQQVGRDVPTVQEWDCADGCPIKALGEQSGERPGGYRINPSTNKTTWFGAKDGSHIEGERGYNDTGTAARYFQQFAPGELFYTDEVTP